MVRGCKKRERGKKRISERRGGNEEKGRIEEDKRRTKRGNEKKGRIEGDKRRRKRGERKRTEEWRKTGTKKRIGGRYESHQQGHL